MKKENNKKSEAGERLQKILAHAGVASRRAAEELIAAGRVRVNGRVVTEMGMRADPAADSIEVDGKPLQTGGARAEQPLVYIALNKPTGVVSTASDTHGRPTVLDLLEQSEWGVVGSKSEHPVGHRKKSEGRVYPVGRLDVDSTGLLLLTNDGELTFRLTHPRWGVEKEYRAVVRGRPGAQELRKLREGVQIESGVTSPARVEEMGSRNGNTLLGITVHEGRKRQIRLMAAAVGHPVVELQRVRVGPIKLGNLPPGKWRYLSSQEIQALKKAVAGSR